MCLSEVFTVFKQIVVVQSSVYCSESERTEKLEDSLILFSGE